MTNTYIIPSVIVVTKCRKKGKKLENDKKIFWENVNGEINEITIRELIRGTLENRNNFRRTFEEQIARRTQKTKLEEGRT